MHWKVLYSSFLQKTNTSSTILVNLFFDTLSSVLNILVPQTKISSPDFVKLADSYGALGLRVEREEEIIPALEQAIKFDGPVMIDFVCENFEMVYPWVLAGQPIDKVLLSREEC